MNAVPLRKEFSDLLVQLNALSASERQILLTFLIGSAPLPRDASSTHASADDAPSSGSVPTAPSEVVGDSVSVINLTSPDHYWNADFLQGETFNLNDLEESQEKSTALANGDESTHASLSTQESRTENDPSVIIDGEVSLPDADTNGPKHDLQTTLHCPLCQLEFPTCIEWEQHLYSGHTSPIAPVCWRCQGLFDNHAVLLAHECFDWCRLNLPGQALLNNSASSTYTVLHEAPLDLRSGESGRPTDEIYLRRRCGLCYKSSVVFTTYQGFQKHKTSAHSVDHVKSCSSGSRRTVCFLPEADELTTEQISPNRFIHPQSEASLHSMIRHLLHHFWYLQNRNLKPSPAADGSQCCPPEKLTADQLLGEGCTETEEGSLHINIHRPSDLRNFRRSSPHRPSFRRSHCSRMIHTRKLRKSSCKRLSTNPYHKHYVANIGSFACLCCPAVFRLASRLRAHYLFKHGHIPESLGGLTPTAEEASLSRKCPVDDSTGCSSDFSDSSDASVESTHRMNMRRTPRQAIRCTRKLGPMIRFPQALRVGHPVGSRSSSQTEDACTRETPSKQRSADSFPSSESQKRIRKMRSKTNSADSAELPNPSSDAPSHTNAEHGPHNEACWVQRPSQGGAGGAQASSSVYQCKLCPRVYSRLFNLQRHHKQAHRGVFRFYCGYCDFRTNDRGALDEHLARHLRLKQFACEFCSARFIVQRELSDHLAFKHSSERRHQCPICTQTFKTAGTLSRHKKVHIGHKRIACSLCSLTFTRPSNLKRHMHRCHRASRMNGELVVPGKRSGARPRRITLAEMHLAKEATTAMEEPCKTASHKESNNDVSRSSADLDASNGVLSVSSSIEPESHVTAENGVISATALVTSEANMFPLNTIFVPYVTAEVDASIATSLAISEAISLKIGSDQSTTLASSGDYVSTHSAADLESNVSETISIAQKAILPSIALASLFPIRITNHFPSTEPTVPQNNWSAPSNAAFDAQSSAPTDSSLPYGCFTAPFNVAGVLPPTKLAGSSDEDTLSHIWRPIECDVLSIQSSVATMPFHLVAPLHGKSEAQQTSCMLTANVPSNESLEVSQLLSNANPIDQASPVRDSPRFPSPVSGSYSPAHHPHRTSSASATPPSPTPADSADSVVEQGGSDSSSSGTFVSNEGLDPVPNPLPSSSSHSIRTEPNVFHPPPYSDSNRPIPVQFIVCDSHTGCPQFLSPMWNCTTSLESHPPYSTSMCLSPTTSHQSVADSCSNFSVGYLIGQPTSCGPVATEDHMTSPATCSASSSTNSNTVHFGFGPSRSS